MTTSTKPDLNRRHNERAAARDGEAGFSLIELLIVVAIMLIMAAIVTFSMTSHKNLYKSDDETLRIINVMREASQLALTQRQAMRVEIDATNKRIKLIDENFAGTTDDRVVRTVYLDNSAIIRVDAAPIGVTKPNPPNLPDAVFTGTAPKVWKIWFRRDGTATDSAQAALSATLYIWPPDPADSTRAKDKKLVRAITIFGGSGAIRLWKHNGTTFVAS
jgi:type II secretion system protein H